MKIIRKLLKGISLTAALFVFQACYGTAYDDYDIEANMTVRVVEDKDGLPLEGIKVESEFVEALDGESVSTWSLCGYTDSTGMANVYAVANEWQWTHFRFTDEDSLYAVRDTVINQWTDTLDIVLTRLPHAK